MKIKVFNLLRLVFGLLIIVAVFAQFFILNQKPDFNPINYFSYLTILSNLFVGSVLLISIKKANIDNYRGAVTLYILTVGFGFIFLLHGQNDEFEPWVNIIVHYLSPVIMAIDWFANPIKNKIRFKNALVWIIPLFVYLTYSMIRGAIVGWYPYGFLNPSENGVLGIFIYSSIVTIGSIILIWTLTKFVRTEKSTLLD